MILLNNKKKGIAYSLNKGLSLIETKFFEDKTQMIFQKMTD